MHCIERTSWVLCLLYLILQITICLGAPPPANTTSVNITKEEFGSETINDNGSFASPEFPLLAETTTSSPQLRPFAPPLLAETTTSSPQLRPFAPPINTGPGNYLDTRRVQMEGRLQRVETQVNLLLETQRLKADTKPDPEQELNTAIQYGLSCERGDTILVCLMKKVVILRREMSGIRRDISDIGKRVVYLEKTERETKDTGKGISKNMTEKGETGKGSKPETGNNNGQDADSKPGNGNSTSEGTFEILEETHRRHDPFCPPRYDRVGSLCYYVVRDRTGGVASSRDYCQSNGGYLARPRDSLTIHDLANHLTHMNETVSELWVDGQYKTEEKSWRWNDGQQIDSSIWGLPDTPSKYHRTGTCVLLKKELNYLAMPQDCGYHYFFVCEAEPTKATPSL